MCALRRRLCQWTQSPLVVLLLCIVVAQRIRSGDSKEQQESAAEPLSHLTECAGECAVAAQEEGRQQGLECDHGAVLGVPAEAGHPQHQGDLLTQLPEPAPG